MPESSYSNPPESDSPRGYGGSGEETVQTQTASPQGTVDMDAVRAARREIEGLVQEIAEMSRTDVAADVFYAALLNKVVQALAALGGAVWIIGETGGLQLQYQINVHDTGLQNDPVAQMQHGRLLTHVMESGDGTLIAPHSGAGEASEGDENAAANPTDFLLILSPVHNDQGPQGVVEVFQRPGARVATQRGYLNFLDQMCELAGDYLKAQRLRGFTDKQTLWEQLEAFTRTAHQTLDLRQTAYSIANDGRRLIGCDRVSVAIQRGGKCKIESVSGQDTFDKRSNVISMLGRLATAVTATGEDLWYTGDTTDLAPQVEDALDAYIDESHSKAVAVLPLFTPRLEEETAPDEDEPEPPKVVGALIVEQMVDSRTPEGLVQRVDIVRQHSASAITNSQEHESLFLMPLWKTIGKTRWLVRARTLPKTVAVSAIILLVLLWLCFWPADFALQAGGKLQPTIRRNVFAAVDGQVDELLVDHDQHVEQGKLLVRLKNSELEKDLTAIQGQIATKKTELATVRRMQRDRAGQRRGTDIELRGDAAQLRVDLKWLESQAEWLSEQRNLLEVTSPIEGDVTSWKLRERLQGRPVNRGNLLMEIADPSGPWELELTMPERRMGHITQAANANDGPLEVTFILATSPEDEHQGKVAEIEGTAEVRGEDGNTVLIRVDFDQALLNEFTGLRPGAEVTAKVHCGTAPIGYVWLHDLIGWVRSKVLFRF